MGRFGVIWVGLALLAVAPASAGAADAPTRYSLANGCYTVAGVPGAERVRMQATGLGRYLLYRPDKTFVAAGGGTADAPGPTTDWRVAEAPGGAFALTPMSGGSALTGRFTPAEGCATYPEAALDATGTPAK